MGLKEKKKPHKEKAKRKRGKKFKYDPLKEQKSKEKINPFEEYHLFYGLLLHYLINLKKQNYYLN